MEEREVAGELILCVVGSPHGLINMSAKLWKCPHCDRVHALVALIELSGLEMRFHHLSDDAVRVRAWLEFARLDADRAIAMDRATWVHRVNSVFLKQVVGRLEELYPECLAEEGPVADPGADADSANEPIYH